MINQNAAKHDKKQNTKIQSNIIKKVNYVNTIHHSEKQK